MSGRTLSGVTMLGLTLSSLFLFLWGTGSLCIFLAVLELAL